MKSIYTLIWVCLIGNLGWSQERIVLGEVINRVVSNNPILKIQAQNIQIATNNISKANTGQLPSVRAVGAASYNNTYTDLDIRTFQEAPAPDEVSISEWGVQSITSNIGLEANYVIWDGGAGQFRYKLYEGVSNIERSKQEVIISELIFGSVSLFYELVKVQNQISILEESVDVTEERILKLKDKREFGKASDLDILQAETNLNQDLSSIDDLVLLKQNLEYDLKILMDDNSVAGYTYIIEDEIADNSYGSELRDQIANHNPELTLLKMGVDLAELQLELEAANRKPTISIFGNAGYFYQRNDVQQLAQIQTLGATVGINASYNLYDGGRQRIKIQNAKLSKRIELDKVERRLTELEMDAKQKLNTINYLKAQINREEENFKTYELNFNKVSERNQSGKLPEIVLREAQLALSNSKIKVTNYQADLQKAYRLLGLILGSSKE